MKRVLYFMATNIAILVVVSVVFQVLGIQGILDESGSSLNLTSLLIFSAIVGFLGSFISLAISKWSAKRLTGARVIEQPANATEAWLLSTVQRQAAQAGIGMPEVAVYDSPEINAFATGARKNSALVAVTTGLLQGMNQQEAEAVLGHEVSHIANGDMVTLALIQGVLNTFVVFLSRVVGFVVDRVVFKTESGVGIGYFITSLVAQVLLGILASIVVAWFSRRREFQADAGGARLAGRNSMIAALERLRQGQNPSQLPSQLEAMGISGGVGRFGKLFMSHPPLEERIASLRSATVL